MVDRHRRDPAPVVDARVEQSGEVVVGEVRRCLHGDVVREQQARGRDRPEMVVEARLGVSRHARPGLGAEVLDDHLLQVAVPLVHEPQRLERVEPLGARLADPDQDPARERDPQLARELDCPQPPLRQLVRRGPVRAALGGEPLRDRLEHDSHRGRDRAERRQLLPRHHARIQVRQQARLIEHELRDAGEVLERRLAAQLGELRARDLVAQLRLVAEREERLGAARGSAGAGNCEHLLRVQVRTLAAPRGSGERAVAADVAAERRQRDEDLRGEGDEAAAAPPPACRREQVVERRLEQRIHAETLTSHAVAPEPAEALPAPLRPALEQRLLDREALRRARLDSQTGQQERVRGIVQLPRLRHHRRPGRVPAGGLQHLHELVRHRHPVDVVHVPLVRSLRRTAT